MEKVEMLNTLQNSVKEFAELKGRCLYHVEQIEDQEIRFYLTKTNYLRFYHYQDCCEEVYIESISGDLNDLIGAPLLIAEEVSGITQGPLNEHDESYTWTFYRFATKKGYVDIRWYGTSNGYYSESVSIEGVTVD